MRNILVGILIFCLLFVAAIYVFVPGKLKIVTTKSINCNVSGAVRTLGDLNTWQKWWPQSNDPLTGNDPIQCSLFYKGNAFHPSAKFYNAIELLISNGHFSVGSRLDLIKLSLDSTLLVWNCQLYAGLNPITRVINYREAKKLKSNMADVLSTLGGFLEKKKNIYGIHPQVTMSKDSTLVAIKEVTETYPSTADIYGLIGRLKKYILLHHAVENNFPMLHVEQLDQQNFETMVAIPVNRQLPGEGKIFFSRFVPWKVLTAEVKGGNYTVNEALRQMKLYINDYQLTSMAIPFESLVTNRIDEPDTAKWVTKIYTPVP